MLRGFAYVVVAEFEISPHFIDDIAFAQGYFDSPLGRLKCEWKRDGDRIELSIFVPNGMNGRLVLDDNFKQTEKIPKNLVGGEYKISLELR